MNTDGAVYPERRRIERSRNESKGNRCEDMNTDGAFYPEWYCI
jgi:hypothetical protein